MLTMENTKGFSQKELNEMNEEARHVRSYQNPRDMTEDGLKWAEGAVLEQHIEHKQFLNILEMNHLTINDLDFYNKSILKFIIQKCNGPMEKCSMFDIINRFGPDVFSVWVTCDKLEKQGLIYRDRAEEEGLEVYYMIRGA
jgi:DNA-binding MarR family transcriptional regulator